MNTGVKYKLSCITEYRKKLLGLALVIAVNVNSTDIF